ncbi:hypothetical protein ACIREO_07590 [Streptomyces sp. NPDC102441]|uniref:hypothetical protein n=1 Tax=Streptomyces sp. NPDC102441 TaxID=3366176 RepID=UPI0037FE0EC2
MNWMPLVSTLAGAVIGISATLIADRNRWQREQTGPSGSSEHSPADGVVRAR